MPDGTAVPNYLRTCRGAVLRVFFDTQTGRLKRMWGQNVVLVFKDDEAELALTRWFQNLNSPILIYHQNPITILL